MTMGMILQAIMIVLGFALLCETVSSLARRKMTEPFCLTWGLISIIIVLAGCLLRPSGLDKYISPTGLVLVILIGFCIVYGAHFLSHVVSDLMRKNNELAIQVTLLRHELEELKNEKTAICNQHDGESRSGDGDVSSVSETGSQEV